MVKSWPWALINRDIPFPIRASYNVCVRSTDIAEFCSILFNMTESANFPYLKSHLSYKIHFGLNLAKIL